MRGVVSEPFGSMESNARATSIGRNRSTARRVYRGKVHNVIEQEVVVDEVDRFGAQHIFVVRWSCALLT